MADKTYLYLPSSTPGKVWKCYATKSRGCVCGVASEGVLRVENGYTSYTHALFSDPVVWADTTATRATAKANAAALAALHAKLKAGGKLADETPALSLAA